MAHSKTVDFFFSIPSLTLCKQGKNNVHVAFYLSKLRDTTAERTRRVSGIQSEGIQGQRDSKREGEREGGRERERERERKACRRIKSTSERFAR